MNGELWTVAIRPPSGVSTSTWVPPVQWLSWTMPIATLVLKSGDQAAEVTCPTRVVVPGA